MEDILRNIRVGDKSFLMGDMTQQFHAIILLSELKTEELPKGTCLPLLLRYKVKSGAAWTDAMQRLMCDFIISNADMAIRENKKVLICSDGGDSRAPAALVRLLIKLGFRKTDAVKIIKEKTGHAPDSKILKSFPDLDEKRMIITAMKVFGKAKALKAVKSLASNFGLTEIEYNKIPELTDEEKEIVEE